MVQVIASRNHFFAISQIETVEIVLNQAENLGMDKPLPTNLDEFAAEERKFLHDLANPLAIATGMLEAYRDEFERSGLESTEALTRKITKLESALARIGVILTDRRPRLIAIQEAAMRETSAATKLGE